MCRKLVLLILTVLFCYNPLYHAQQVMAMPKGSTPANGPTVTGTIVETMNASGYTYMLVDNGTEKTWVAIPASNVEKGATVNYYEGMVMTNFASKTLNRTFDSVVFSPGLADEKAAAVQQPATKKPNDSFSDAVKAEKMSTAPAPAMDTSAGSAGAIAPLEEISIEKATSANGYTVEEIFTKAGELAGKKSRYMARS